MQTIASLSDLLIDRDAPYIERDLSWLQFNERVLAEALDRDNPLLERLKFLGITSSNLDEFFMIRFAALSREVTHLSKNMIDNAAKLKRLSAVRSNVLTNVLSFHEKQARTLHQLTKDLHRSNVSLWRDLNVNPKLQRIARDVFEQHVANELHVPRHFGATAVRRLMNLQLGLLFRSGMFVAVPKAVPTILWKLLPNRTIAVFFLDDLLKEFAGSVLGESEPPLVLRVTRDCDVVLELEDEDPESIPNAVRRSVSAREVRRAVRLQVTEGDSGISEQILDTFRLPVEQLFRPAVPLSLAGVVQFVLEMRTILPRRTRLLYPVFSGFVPIPFHNPERVLPAVKRQDFIFHQPYDSFDSYVHFIAAAVADPKVKAIYQTVYRTDALSPVVEMLRQAARSKQIVVVIEPRARFDEINNIRLAEELRHSGATVYFATGQLKVHAKVTLVVREADGQREMYTHLSTGNYNAKTARQYTDFAIATSHQDIGEDALRFFEAVIAEKTPEGMKQLVLAPTGLHRRILALIKAETHAAERGLPARIFAKVNALVDARVIEMLYRASQAGVQVDLVVRGACSLIPGIAGVSDKIRVLSIVDRYLEHSRMYYFQNERAIYLSSADWMPRNFFSRMEIAFPVLDPRLFAYLTEVVIPTYLKDGAKARILNRQGIWQTRTGRIRAERVRSQFVFEELARRKYRGTPIG